MTVPKLLLHLGYGKTGTSTLQKAVFERLRKDGRIHYFGMFLDSPKGHPDRRFFDDLQAAMYLDNSKFTMQLPALREQFSGAVARNTGGLPMVLSNEHFLLSAWSTRLAGVSIKAEQTALRLANVFANLAEVRLLVGIRRQDSFLRSFFVESAARAGHANAEHFARLEQFIDQVLNPDSIFHSMCDYMGNLDAYRAAFRLNRVSIYLFEEFVRDPGIAIREICTILGFQADLMEAFTQSLPMHNAKRRVEGGVEIPARASYETKLRRTPLIGAFAAWLATSPALSPIVKSVRSIRTIRDLRPEEAACIMSFYSPSNFRLVADYPHLAEGLRKYGYCPDKPSKDCD